MSPEKPITPPEKVVTLGGVVYEIIPGSEDIPDTEWTFGGPHYWRNGLGRWASPSGCYTVFIPAHVYDTEKPITPPEKVVSLDGVVYEIIPGSEDIPDTGTTFGGPHYTRNGLGQWASPSGSYNGFTPALGYITEEEAEVWNYPSTIHSTFRS